MNTTKPSTVPSTIPSTELSSKQKNANKAFTIHQEIIQLKNIAGGAFIVIGQRLKEIKEKELFHFLGDGGYETFESYLGSPELQFDRRKAYYLIQIYSTFCEGLNVKQEDISGIYWTTLRQILPIINKENHEEWIEKARTLSRSDLELELRQFKSGVSPATCNHEWEEITFWRCKNCGERSNVCPTEISDK